jgi:hypothetical protein
MIITAEGPKSNPAGQSRGRDSRHAQDLTFAVRVGCATCGYLMLFDSARYRTGDEKILVLGLERESQREQ